MSPLPQIPAPALIHELVETFAQNFDEYRSSKNETELRREFLDKFFTALGWDVANEKRYDETHKEVIHEYSVEVAGQGKKADYAFRARAGQFDFLVEAKKPSVNIENNQEAAFQLRRYGWSAKLPLNILTDFEHFAVYDCRAKPSYTDKASVGRLLLIHYTEYAERWDEIVALFSPEAVRLGAFAKYAEGLKGKRGTAAVDDAFLQEIERWRELLAKNLALRNPEIDVPGLNYAVQMTIDRIVFLRICEERGIEPENQLLHLASGEGVYAELCRLFKRADTKFNSGMFHFKKEKEQFSRPDDLTLGLTVDDKVLKDILANLYYPKSPYAFLYIPADILGQIYERFLGKVIRLTAGHQAKVEDKPEVRKAGGVYYTPTYIVAYIVLNTIGKLLLGLTPTEAARLKFLDPACGSGSFLLGAFEYLLAWHLQWYTAHDPDAWVKKNALVKVGEDYRLTTPKKKEILLNNIYGVDIDPQAVNVTKLSLLLKVLENPTGQLALGLERILPDLGHNIKCGNSLIGSDYFEGQMLPDEAERTRVNPFDWQTEFKSVFANGGFDAVIGNPPWGAEFAEADKAHLDRSYSLNTGKYESYIYFVELGTRLLVKNGLFGFIIPSYWVSRSQTEAIRVKLSEQLTPVAFVMLPENVFIGVKMDSCIVVAKNALSDKRLKTPIKVGEISTNALKDDLSPESIDLLLHEVTVKQWTDNPNLRFNPRISGRDIPIMEKVSKSAIALGELVEITQGLTLYRLSTLTEKFGKAKAEEIVNNRLFHFNKKKDKTFKKELLGKDISRYYVEWNGESWVSYGPWLAHAVDERFFHGPRLVIQKIRNPTLQQRLVVAYLDDDETYSAGVLLNALLISKTYSLFYLMGLLNSKLINFWYRKSILDVSIRVVDLREVSIHPINFSDPAEKAQHDQMVSLVEQMLVAHKSLAAAQSPAAQEQLERHLATTDRAIDALVYALYGLSEDEIRIVEA